MANLRSKEAFERRALQSILRTNKSAEASGRRALQSKTLMAVLRASEPIATGAKGLQQSNATNRDTSN